MPVDLNPAAKAVQSVGTERRAIIVAVVLLHAPGICLESAHATDELFLQANLDNSGLAIKNETFKYLNNEKECC